MQWEQSIQQSLLRFFLLLRLAKNRRSVGCFSMELARDDDDDVAGQASCLLSKALVLAPPFLPCTLCCTSFQEDTALVIEMVSAHMRSVSVTMPLECNGRNIRVLVPRISSRFGSYSTHLFS